MRINILGVNIDALTVRQTVDAVDEYMMQRRPLHLMGVNADKINSAIDDANMRRLVNECGIINADGASVVLAGKFLGTPLPERVAGVDLMQELVALCEQKGYSIFLLGAKQDVVEETGNVLKSRHTNLNICGIHDGYFADSDWGNIAQLLKETNPHIVFVGITSPKKEYLIEFFQQNGLSCVFMGVGGSFDVISNKIKRAPLWMQKINMEWMFRMMQEPKRLFKRYLFGNSLFILRIAREKLFHTYSIASRQDSY